MHFRQSVNEGRKMKQIPYRLAEALVNICKKKTLENITVSEIAAEAGVTRQVFYNYFEDKYVLASWIHYMDLYYALKRGITDLNQYCWRSTTKEWLLLLQENKAFYTNAFHSASQKEFQRLIKEFFYERYKGMLELIYKKPATEEQIFVVQVYCNGAIEKVYDWVAKGMQVPVERMLDYLELAMPEAIRAILLPSENIPYPEMLNAMEKYLKDLGLLPLLS